jgi:nuclear pore complex protein Nup93
VQTGVIEQATPLLKFSDTHQLNAEVFVPAARQAEESDLVLQAIKLYNLAGEYTTVINSLATALGTTLAAPGGGGERARSLETAASDIIRHYERMGRAPGRARDAVMKLLRVREALDAKAEGRLDRAFEVRTCFVVTECALTLRADRGVDGPCSSRWGRGQDQSTRRRI